MSNEHEYKVGDEVWAYSPYEPERRLGQNEKYTILYVSDKYVIVGWESRDPYSKYGPGESSYTREVFDTRYRPAPQKFEAGKLYRYGGGGTYRYECVLADEQYAWFKTTYPSGTVHADGMSQEFFPAYEEVAE